MLTKEEVEAHKAQLKAIDSRPIKKVAEAKARKKKRLAVRYPPWDTRKKEARLHNGARAMRLLEGMLQHSLWCVNVMQLTRSAQRSSHMWQ